MDSFIRSLKSFAKDDFPVKEVSNFISKTHVSMELLNMYSHFSKKKYTRNMIYKDPDFEILLICWSAGQMVPIHGHEGEKCWAKVQLGTLEICNYNMVSKTPLRLKQIEKINAPVGYLDGPADIHSVNNCFTDPAISLHVYAKPYDSCEIYDIKTNQINRLQMKYHSINGQIC